jgi:hypothetical protein
VAKFEPKCLAFERAVEHAIDVNGSRIAVYNGCFMLARPLLSFKWVDLINRVLHSREILPRKEIFNLWQKF